MGVFDSIGKITEKVVETAVSLPAAPVKMLEGGIKGVQKGIDTIGEAIENFGKD